MSTAITMTAPQPEPPSPSATILVVDDNLVNVKVLEAILMPRGYGVVRATSGADALAAVAAAAPDLVLLDIIMPGMDGYEVCRRLRAAEPTRLLPVVMVTASGPQEKVRAIEAGADDFIQKPVDQAELLARITSLLRIKRYHDTILAQTAALAAQTTELAAQAAQLADWNRTLEQRVAQQVAELERVGRLRRFLSPQLADLVVAAGDERLLESHRREITVVFCDLRGFTPFAETAEPEEVMAVLGQYHAALGELIHAYEGTLERFTGDGLMVFFNDPVPQVDPAAAAVEMTVAMRERVASLTSGWHKRGYDLEFGVGIATGYATLGKIGFEGRFDYAAIGTVTNLAARLCGEAQGGQILISQRVHAAVEHRVDAERLPDVTLKGFARPVVAYHVTALRPIAAARAGVAAAP